MRVVDDPQFGNLPHDVRGLFVAGARTSFFSLPEWYDVVANYGLEQGWRARIYASDGAALVCRVQGSDRPREIHGCSNMYTIEHSVLHADPSRESTHDVRALIAAAAGDSPFADAILLPGLDRDDPSFGAVIQGMRDAGFLAKPYLGWSIWYEPTERKDFDAYLARRPSVLTNTWRRKQAQLERSTRIQFRATGETDVERFICDYEDVYRRSWKKAEPFLGFVPALIRMAQMKGVLRYGVLEADGKPIAAQFWIIWRGRAIIYKLSYDEKWRQFSPGTLLTMHMIRTVLECDHPDEINFGRGDDPYKKLWMSKRRERWGIEAANPRTARGLARSLRLRAAIARDRVLGRQ